MKIGYHILYWSLCCLFLVLYYGRRNENIDITLWLVAGLLPVSMLATYTFNYFLIPRYLVPRRYGKFFLYAFYTIVIAAFIEFGLLLYLFVFVADLNINAADFDSVYLLAGMFSPVLVGIAVKLFRIFQQEEVLRSTAENEKLELIDRLTPSTLTVPIRADRKTYNIKPSEINYLEGLKDYVIVNLEDKKPLITKETLSSMTALLEPFGFIRTHKSFVISVHKVTAYNNEKILIGEKEIPIGRSYKKQVADQIPKKNITDSVADK